jgi:hypothetical protein
MRSFILFNAVWILALISSCGGRSSNDDLKLEDTEAIATLPLPDVPDAFVTVEDRAGYVLRHFWDKLNFTTDTVLSRNRDFMEQNFANYISIFSLPDRTALVGTVKRLLFRAQVDSLAYNMLTDIAEKYLYAPDSPMQNEDYYEIFLMAEGDSEFSSGYRSKLSYQQSCISKNRVGNIAADFDYLSEDGVVTSLSDTETPGYMLLVFFDPSCDDCRKSVEMLEEEIVMNRMLKEHELSILAIDVADNEEMWEAVKRTYPSSWKIGLDTSGLRDKEIYVMRNMPSMYLLDHNKRVLLKDAQVEALFAFLCNESGVTFTENPERNLVHL